MQVSASVPREIRAEAETALRVIYLGEWKPRRNEMGKERKLIQGYAVVQKQL